MYLDFPKILSDASHKYYKMVIIIGLPDTGKTKTITKFKEHIKAQYVNLNLVLSEKLLNFSSSEQQHKVEEILHKIIESSQNKTLLFDNTEILFDPNLNLNVLNLFKTISKHQTCIVSWTGSYSDGKLRYSDSGYWGSKQSYDIDDIEIINLNCD